MSQLQPETSSLLDLIMNLLRNPSELAAFQADPHGYLRNQGFEDVTAQDVNDVIPLVAESAGVQQAGGSDLSVPEFSPADTSFQSAVDQLQFVTTNFRSDIDIDNSRRFELDIDKSIRAEDGSIVAGRDLAIDDANVVTGNVEESVLADDISNSNVATSGGQAGDGSAFGDGSAVQSGQGNVAGIGNQAVTGTGAAGAFGDESQALANSGEGDQLGVQGDGNTLAVGEGNQVFQDSQVAQDNVGAVGFGQGDTSSAISGEGDATSANLDDVRVDDGGALAIGGDAEGQNQRIEAEEGSQVVNAGDDVENANLIDDVAIDASDDDIDASQQVDASVRSRLEADIEDAGDVNVLGG